MKDIEDAGTGDMFGVKRGRPKMGTAKTGAERAYRKQSRDRANLSAMISVEARVSLDALACLILAPIWS